MKLNFKESPLDVIYFKVTKPRSTATRRLKIKNNCGMRVQYHWSIYKTKFVEKISLAGEETHYNIEPLQGVFAGNEELEFTISFRPIHAESYFEYADLIVDDIPIQAVPDAPASLKALLTPAGVGGPSYIGSNTRYPSFPYLKFTLQGYGDSCEIVSDPPVLAFPGDMLANKSYVTRIKLLNKSKSHIKLRLYLRGKTSEQFSVTLGSTHISPVAAPGREGLEYQGVLDDEVEELDVNLLSKSIGMQRAYFEGEVEDGNPFSFEVFGHFAGPRVRLIEKAINYGLVRTNTPYEFRLNLENLTDIDAEVLIKNAKNQALTFATLNPGANSDPTLPQPQPQPQPQPPTPGPASKHLPAVKSDSAIAKTASLTIVPEYLKLGPLDKTSVLVTLQTGGPETVAEDVEVMTKLQGSQHISLHAEVQKPHLSLNRTRINLESTYAGIQYKVDGKHKSALYIRNHGNHDAQFHVLPPHSA